MHYTVSIMRTEKKRIAGKEYRNKMFSISEMSELRFISAKNSVMIRKIVTMIIYITNSDNSNEGS